MRFSVSTPKAGVGVTLITPRVQEDNSDMLTSESDAKRCVQLPAFVRRSPEKQQADQSTGARARAAPLRLRARSEAHIFLGNRFSYTRKRNRERKARNHGVSAELPELMIKSCTVYIYIYRVYELGGGWDWAVRSRSWG